MNGWGKPWKQRRRACLALALAAVLANGCAAAGPILFAGPAQVEVAMLNNAAMPARPKRPDDPPPESWEHALRSSGRQIVCGIAGCLGGMATGYAIGSCFTGNPDMPPNVAGGALGAAAGMLGGLVLAAVWERHSDPWPPKGYRAAPLAQPPMAYASPAVEIPDLQAQLRAEPGSAQLWEGLGDSQVRGGQMGAALASYQRALLLDPANPTLKYKVQALQPPSTSGSQTRGRPAAPATPGP